MVWDALIACYLFLAGLGAGAYAFSVIVGWKNPVAVKYRTIGLVIALVAVVLGTLMLMVDAKAGLANPLRFFLLLSNPSSVMTWGVVILCLFIVATLAALVVLRRKGRTPRALDVAGLVLAVCVAAYTGVLLGASVGYPLWNPVVLPLLFAVSAASTGFASVRLTGFFLARDESLGDVLGPRTGIALPVAEALLLAMLLALTASAGGSAAAAGASTVSSLLVGPYAVAFWLGLVALGLVLPFAVQVVALRCSPNKDAGHGGALGSVGEAGAIVGGFVLRYLVVLSAVPLVLL